MKRQAEDIIGSKARSVAWRAVGDAFIVEVKDAAGKVVFSRPCKFLSEAISTTRTMAKDRRLRMEAR